MSFDNCNLDILSATRSYIDAFEYYLKVLNIHGVNTSNVMENTNYDIIQRLCSADHRRWVAERTVSGWRQANTQLGEVRLNAAKIHILMVEYEKLSGIDREQDYNRMLKIFKLDSMFRALKVKFRQ